MRFICQSIFAMRGCVFLFTSVLIGTAVAQDGLVSTMTQLYDECSQSDWSTCLKMKLVASLEKFRGSSDIRIVDGLVLTAEQQVDNAEPVIDEKNLDESLPRQMEARNQILDSLIADKLSNLASKYSLKWKLSNLQDAISEGRGKKKYGHHHLLLMPMMMAASFIPIAMGTLAILAGKALIVGKMALLLVGIIGIRKLFSNGEDEDHQRAMKRISDFGMKLKTDMMAHQMAYRSQMTPLAMNTPM